MNCGITLITGGASSGKSAHALRLGRELGARRAFIATATALDEEMAGKIETHRQERGPGWHTVEEPRDLAAAVRQAAASCDVVLVDCLTMWISNLLTLYGIPEHELRSEVDALAAALQDAAAPVILVTNEVGLGIMPADRLSRQYQKLLGQANMRIAGIAGSVYMMMSGIALRLR